LHTDEVCSARIEHASLPEIQLEDYNTIIVGGKPLDVRTPEDAKTDIKKSKVTSLIYSKES
jgi:hypothetical protein